MHGNAHGTIPELVSSLMLALFPQVPTVIYLGFVQEKIFNIEQNMCFIMLVILTAEILLGLITVRVLIHAKADAFYRSCEEKR